VAVLEQQLLGLGAAFDQRRFQPLRHGRAQFAVVAALRLHEFFEFGRNRARIDKLARGPAWMLGRDACSAFEGERGHCSPPIAEVGAEVIAHGRKCREENYRRACFTELEYYSLNSRHITKNIRLNLIFQGLIE
jgi:hypothetical protein